MNKTKQVIKYIIFDFLGSSLAWGSFYLYRKIKIEESTEVAFSLLTQDKNFINGILGISAIWILIYALLGNYRNIYRKSRVLELSKTLIQHLFGVLVIFFLFLLDDQIKSPSQYYLSTSVYFTLQTLFVYTNRYLILRNTNKKVHRKEIGYPTLLVGGGNIAVDLYLKMENNYRSSGNIFVGFLSPTNSPIQHRLENYLPKLGDLDQLEKIIEKKGIQEVIVATEEEDHKIASKVIQKLENEEVKIKAIPTLYDILSGSVKMSSLFDVPLISIENKLTPIWQNVVKRIIDIVLSLFVLTILSPLLITCAILVRFSSKGPIFYFQERIGLQGKPFQIIKFRSMYTNSEDMGPQLSKDNDPRITPWGRIMRKYRLDEFPQFYNVLIGEMSLVGPRPERQFYIDQIVERAPYYKQLHRVKPGITSWGMVKYGYAENVDQMLERLKFDLIYLENISLLNDFKVIVYTFLIVFQGRGK
jgi:exopolysaccharide biosynthesis polyprenyl glycosylphosphotransferase